MTANPDHGRRPDRQRSTDVGELYERLLAPVTAYVAVRMREVDPHAVPDLVHDAFCDALADPGHLDDDPLGGLLRLAAKACTAYESSRRRFIGAVYTLCAHQHAAAPSPTAPAFGTDTSGDRLAADLLARLDDTQRQVIRLRYLDGCTRAETAAALGATAAAVRHLERQALQHLRADLTRPDPAPATA